MSGTKPDDTCTPMLREQAMGGLQVGLTKREHFACQIYAGMSSIADNSDNRKVSAYMAVELADELIKALNSTAAEAAAEVKK